MTDVTAASATGFRLPGIGGLGALFKRGDLALAIGVMAILVVLLLPLPATLLDMALALSIILSVLILMTALFIQTPLEFSSFPTVLLIATMLRLSLNLASTRLILSRGHEGTAAAGHVIEAFGNFVMSGNFVIGIIVFTILVIVNFVVITKGSGRIAEVAARFNLDAMPGKQMAIDADLSAGLINENDARTRRKHLEDESGFFGAMDGASKFVRGDAIAGLLVVFINVIGGMIIGIAQQGMPFAEAARTYTLLTVGDGLVTQIPALIVSTAAGLLVSKAGVGGGVDKALLKQLSGYPKALGMSAAVMIVMSLLPGIPMLPFLALGAGAGVHAYVIKLKEVDAGQGRVWPNQHMVMDPTGAQVNLPGLHTTEPTFGLPATWVDATLKEEAAIKGYTVVDAATVLATHLTEVLKTNMAELLSYAEVQKLLKDLSKEQGELVKDISPSLITPSGIQRVLQLLLAERVSIRDLATILEGIADALAFTRNPTYLAEHVRARLARQICAQHASPAGYVPLIALSPKWEQAFAESIVGQGEEKSLAMQPSKLSEFITLVRDRFEDAAREGEAPVLVTSPGVRPFVRSIVERFRTQTSVLSQSEIHPRVRLKTVGGI